MTDWLHPTLADHLGTDPGAIIRCKCRLTARADQMIDVRNFPPHQKPLGVEFICDGCWETLRREGYITHEEAARHNGAPSEVLERMRAIDEHPSFRHIVRGGHHRMKLGAKP